MVLSKYPVISPEGNQYKVDIYEYYGALAVDIYIDRERTKLAKVFRLSRFTKISDGCIYGVYNAKEWDYDLISIAEHAVCSYEEKLAEERRETGKLSEGVRDFLKWDGKIRMEAEREC